MDWFHLAAPKPVGKHEFSDILDAQGFKPTSDQESQTLSSLKKEQNKPEDPIKAKVNYKNDFTHLVWLPWRIYFLITKFIEKKNLPVKDNYLPAGNLNETVVDFLCTCSLALFEILLEENDLLNNFFFNFILQCTLITYNTIWTLLISYSYISFNINTTYNTTATNKY